jgi:hypothetical protein
MPLKLISILVPKLFLGTGDTLGKEKEKPLYPSHSPEEMIKTSQIISCSWRRKTTESVEQSTQTRS